MKWNDFSICLQVFIVEISIIGINLKIALGFFMKRQLIRIEWE
jgi:hypothetical protein